MSAEQPLSDAQDLERLRQLRPMLLRLHKALLESEREVYEEFNGAIPSKGQFFQLVIGDDWFSWLRPMSQFIVKIDEVIFSKKPEDHSQAGALLKEARSLLNPLEYGNPMEKQYYQAIQRDPTIAGLHAEIQAFF